MIDELATQLDETREYAIRPAFKYELRKSLLMQFIRHTLIANMRAQGLSEEQIAQCGEDVCPCAHCCERRK
jgi:hypothetical protein